VTARSPRKLPETRPELMALHAVARRQRAAAALGSDAYRAACEEIAVIEVRISEIERRHLSQPKDQARANDEP
jgi:transcription elongation GreA/GreB family factor